MRRFLIAAAAMVAAFSVGGAQAAPPGPPPVQIQPGAYFPWGAFVCPAMILFSAAVAAAKDGRELTSLEAFTCGSLYWFGQPPKQYVHKIKHR